jgi:hypothetical protein
MFGALAMPLLSAGRPAVLLGASERHGLVD